MRGNHPFKCLLKRYHIYHSIVHGVRWLLHSCLFYGYLSAHILAVCWASVELPFSYVYLYACSAKLSVILICISLWSENVLLLQFIYITNALIWCRWSWNKEAHWKPVYRYWQSPIVMTQDFMWSGVMCKLQVANPYNGCDYLLDMLFCTCSCNLSCRGHVCL